MKAVSRLFQGWSQTARLNLSMEFGRANGSDRSYSPRPTAGQTLREGGCSRAVRLQLVSRSEFSSLPPERNQS